MAWRGVAGMMVCLSSGCTPRHMNDGLAKEVISEKDQRVEGRHPQVGSLMYRNTVHHCMATAISSNVIVTARHCYDEGILNSEVKKDFKFKLRDKEYEILNIQKTIGENVFIYLNEKIDSMKEIVLENPQEGLATSYTWSDEKKDYVYMISHLNKDEFKESYFLHSLDTEPGSSGSPVFQNEKLVGIHQGYDVENKKNISSYLFKDTKLVDFYETEWKCGQRCPSSYFSGRAECLAYNRYCIVTSSAKDDLKGLGVEACIGGFGLQKGLIETASSGQRVEYINTKVALQLEAVAKANNMRLQNYGSLTGANIHGNAQMKAITSLPKILIDVNLMDQIMFSIKGDGTNVGGYAADSSNVYIRAHSIMESCHTIAVVAHELTHLLQYKTVGNHQRDLCGQYVDHGYKSAPWEQEAYKFQDLVENDCTQNRGLYF